MKFKDHEIGALLTLGGTATIIGTARQLVEGEDFTAEEFLEILSRLSNDNVPGLINSLREDLEVVYGWADNGINELYELEAQLELELEAAA